MSFLRNFRSSAGRKNNSKSAPDLNSKKISNTSVVKIGENGDYKVKTGDYKGILKNQQPQSDGLMRSDTFTLSEAENSNTKAKSPHKQSVFEKFSTFTRRKKNSPQRDEEFTTNSYKRYPTPSDPVVISTNSVNSPYTYQGGCSIQIKNDQHSSSPDRPEIDYSTYRKSKLPASVKEELREIQENFNDAEEPFDDPEKFKTVTINSFRKSFREKFLAQQKEAPHNPSWFVEVDPPKEKNGSIREDRKSRRTDMLVFENDNFRPTARSPIRAEDAGHSNKPSVNLKRNETFRVDRENEEPTIRIEIKNSITPREPGRMVPVGVAKPMLSDSLNIQRMWPESNPSSHNSQNYSTKIQIGNNPSLRRNYNPPPPPPQRFEQNHKPVSRYSHPQGLQMEDPLKSDYLPLTSYEMLTQMNRPQGSMRPTYFGGGDHQRFKPRPPPVESSGAPPAYNRKWSQAPTFSSKQRHHTGFMADHAVRREFNKTGPNTRRPWR